MSTERYVKPIRLETKPIRMSGSINSPMANCTRMSADGSPVRQRRTRIRAKPGVGGDERSDEPGESWTETFAAGKRHSKKVTTGHKAEPGQRSRVVEYEEEMGHFDSQRFLDLVKYGSKSAESIKKANKYLEDFKKAIHAQGRDLHSEINRRTTQSSSRDTKFSEYFHRAYTPILHCNVIIKTVEEQFNLNQGRADHPLHQKSTEVLSGAASLIEQLQKSCRKLEAQQTSFTVNTDWQEVIHRMKHILDFGRQIGEQKVESILTGTGKPLLDAPTAEITQLLYDKQNRPHGNLTWDEAVRKQEKAVMRLVNTLLWE